VPSPHEKIIRLDNMNQSLKNAEYAVRGELAIKAEKYKQVWSFFYYLF